MNKVLQLRAFYRILTPQDYLLNQRRACVIKDIAMRVLKPLQRANQGPIDTVDQIKLMGVAKNVVEAPKTDYAFYPDRFFEEVENDGCDLVFLQIDPSLYMAQQRFLAHKCALGKVQDYREDGVQLIDPIKPITFQQTVINPLCLDLMHQNALPKQINYCQGFYTYSSPELQSQERREVVTRLFAQEIGKKVLGGKRTEYPIMDRILYTSLMSRHKVMLGGMPETLYKMILGKGLSLGQLRDIFRTIVVLNKSLTVPMQTKEAATAFMPHIFQLPKDLYMTALLREAFQAATQIIATIDIAHIVPIQSYWISPPDGINMTEATLIPEGLAGESVEDCIEKQAILDVLLSTRTWSKPYLSNPFPYLFDDITKVKKQDLDLCKGLFIKHYRKYSQFLKRELKQLPQRDNNIGLLTADQQKIRFEEMGRVKQTGVQGTTFIHMKNKMNIKVDRRKILPIPK